MHGQLDMGKSTSLGYESRTSCSRTKISTAYSIACGHGWHRENRPGTSGKIYLHLPCTFCKDSSISAYVENAGIIKAPRLIVGAIANVSEAAATGEMPNLPKDEKEKLTPCADFGCRRNCVLANSYCGGYWQATRSGTRSSPVQRNRIVPSPSTFLPLESGGVRESPGSCRTIVVLLPTHSTSSVT